MKRSEALQVCDRLIALLSPVCTRVEAVGSLRRGKEELDEIDLLAIPDLTPPPFPRPEFGKPVPKVYETFIDQWIDYQKREGEIIVRANGPRQKKFYYLPASIDVDLYLVRPPATWGVLQLIRTGPSDFAHWAVTQKRKGGALPNKHRVQDGAVYIGEEKADITKGLPPVGFETESLFLNFLGLPWIEPEDRRAEWGKR